MMVFLFLGNFDYELGNQEILDSAFEKVATLFAT
jgi:hypothetical protein